jgi:hypothetical protein
LSLESNALVVIVATVIASTVIGFAFDRVLVAVTIVIMVSVTVGTTSHGEIGTAPVVYP